LGARLGLAEGSVSAYFLLRPICLVLMALVVFSITFALFLDFKGKERLKPEDIEGSTLSSRLAWSQWRHLSTISMQQWNLLIGIFIIAAGIVIYLYTREFPGEVKIFPIILITSLFFMSGWLILQSLFLPTKRQITKPFEQWPGKRMGSVIGMTFGYILLSSFLGFYSSTFLYMALTPMCLKSNRTSHFFLTCGVTAASFTGIMLVVFKLLLKVPTPQGWLI